jgi:hypothetical protein
VKRTTIFVDRHVERFRNGIDRQTLAQISQNRLAFAHSAPELALCDVRTCCLTLISAHFVPM